jgi:hypothetical protein
MMEKSCKTCLNSGVIGEPLDSATCFACRRLSNYEPRLIAGEAKSAPEHYRAKPCSNCKYLMVNSEDAPCTSCWNLGKVGADNFKPVNGTLIQGEWDPKEHAKEVIEETMEEFSNSNPGMEGQYTFRGGIEPLDFVMSNRMDFLEGNVVKYVYRYPFKGGLEALMKARFYLNMLIERWHEDHEEDADN